MSIRLISPTGTFVHVETVADARHFIDEYGYGLADDGLLNYVEETASSTPPTSSRPDGWATTSNSRTRWL